MGVDTAIEAVDAFDALSMKVVGVAEALRCVGYMHHGEPDHCASVLSDVLYGQVDVMHGLQGWLNGVMGSECDEDAGGAEPMQAG